MRHTLVIAAEHSRAAGLLWLLAIVGLPVLAGASTRMVLALLGARPIRQHRLPTPARDRVDSGKLVKRGE